MLEKYQKAPTDQGVTYPVIWLPVFMVTFCPHSSHLRFLGFVKGASPLLSSSGQFLLPADQANTTLWRTAAPISLVYSL